MKKNTIKLEFISQPIDREIEDKETKEIRKYKQIICEDEEGFEYRINVNTITSKLESEIESKEITYKEITPVTSTFKGKTYKFSKIILPKSSLIESF